MKEEEIKRLKEKIKNAPSLLKKQLLIVALISKILKEKGKNVPLVVGGCALSYYSREVYLTNDIDLLYADIEALDAVLKNLGFKKEGRFWYSEELELVIEVPGSFPEEEIAPLEKVIFDEEDLECFLLSVEDIILDRLKACKYLKSQIDCEMAEVLIARYFNGIDWDYIKRKSKLPENDVFDILRKIKKKYERKD